MRADEKKLKSALACYSKRAIYFQGKAKKNC